MKETDVEQRSWWPHAWCVPSQSSTTRLYTSRKEDEVYTASKLLCFKKSRASTSLSAESDGWMQALHSHLERARWRCSLVWEASAWHLAQSCVRCRRHGLHISTALLKQHRTENWGWLWQIKSRPSTPGQWHTWSCRDRGAYHQQLQQAHFSKLCLGRGFSMSNEKLPTVAVAVLTEELFCKSFQM